MFDGPGPLRRDPAARRDADLRLRHALLPRRASRPGRARRVVAGPARAAPEPEAAARRRRTTSGSRAPSYNCCAGPNRLPVRFGWTADTTTDDDQGQRGRRHGDQGTRGQAHGEGGPGGRAPARSSPAHSRWPNAESGTPIWLALRTDASTFWIVDAFPGEPERQAHLQGQIAAALLGRADELLGAPPEINQADVLAAKPATDTDRADRRSDRPAGGRPTDRGRAHCSAMIAANSASTSR